MAGALTAGYWHANYFTHRYWQIGNQYWIEYGAAPSGVVAVLPKARRPTRRRYRARRKLRPSLMSLLFEWLKVKS